MCHNDTTSASVYGQYNKKTSEGINITFGHSKKHRQDLKQFIWSMSVSSDSAFPLFQQAYNGNTADVNTYVEQWTHLVDLLDRFDFLYVADSKLITKEAVNRILFSPPIGFEKLGCNLKGYPIQAPMGFEKLGFILEGK